VIAWKTSAHLMTCVMKTTNGKWWHEFQLCLKWFTKEQGLVMSKNWWTCLNSERHVELTAFQTNASGTFPEGN